MNRALLDLFSRFIKIHINFLTESEDWELNTFGVFIPRSWKVLETISISGIWVISWEFLGFTMCILILLKCNSYSSYPLSVECELTLKTIFSTILFLYNNKNYFSIQQYCFCSTIKTIFLFNNIISIQQ